MEGGFLQEMYRRNVANLQGKFVCRSAQQRSNETGELWQVTGTMVHEFSQEENKFPQKVQELGNVRNLEEYTTSRKELMSEMRRARRGHETALADRIKENPRHSTSMLRARR